MYRKIVRKNFEHVGIWGPGIARRITVRLYRNIGRYAVDFLRSGGRPPPPYQTRDYELCTEARAKGKGVIVILAHFGNWELLAALFGRKEDDLNVVAKPMGNPLVEKWLLRKRTAFSVRTIHTKNALRGMLGALKRNGIVAVLIDQYLGASMGTPAPFLGKTASTVRTAAGLAYKTGAAAIPVYAIMNDDGSYTVRLIKTEPPVPASNNGDGGGVDEEAAISVIQAQHNNILSGWITEYPEHWFGWFHRRFKGYADYDS